MKKSNRYEGFVLDEYDMEPYSSSNLDRIKRAFYRSETKNAEKLRFYFISNFLNDKEQEVLYASGILKNKTYEESLSELVKHEIIEAASILYQSERQCIKENVLSKAVKIAMLQEDIIFFTEKENREKVKELQEELAYMQGN